MKRLKSILLLCAVMSFAMQWSLVLSHQEGAKKRSQNSTACLEPKAPGLCRGKYLRYAYDNNSGNCISFFYSGCGATQNNFLTYEECRRDCMQRLRY